jgi:hypothetical protein
MLPPHRIRGPLTALAVALALPALAAPTPATAAPARATLTLGAPLARAGVTVRALTPATAAGRRVSLPVTAMAAAGVDLGGALRLRAGRRTVALTGLRLTTTPAPRLAARVDGGARRPLFALGRGAAPELSASRVRLVGAAVTLTAAGARALSRALGRPLPTRRLGTLDLDTGPGAAATVAVTGGELDWGYNASLRTTFASSFAPVLSGGAQQGADGSFRLPIASGAYDATAGTATFASPGGVRIGYQLRPADASGAHGIWVTLWNVSVRLDGASGTIAAASDSGYHGAPPLAAAVRTIATLRLTDVAPQLGADRRTVTWTAVPATVAPGGEELVAPFVDQPGRPSLGDTRQIDPITIVAQLAEPVPLVVG